MSHPVLEPIGGASAGKLEAAQASANRFIDDLTYSRDTLGLVTFRGAATLGAELGTDAASAKTQLAARVGEGIFCAGNFCGGGRFPSSCSRTAAISSPPPDPTRISPFCAHERSSRPGSGCTPRLAARATTW